MGILQPGETVLIVAANEADPMVLEAIKRALVERKVTPHIKFVYEMTGETKEQADARVGSGATKGQRHHEGRHLPGDRLDYRTVPESRRSRRRG